MGIRIYSKAEMHRGIAYGLLDGLGAQEDWESWLIKGHTREAWATYERAWEEASSLRKQAERRFARECVIYALHYELARSWAVQFLEKIKAQAPVRRVPS